MSEANSKYIYAGIDGSERSEAAIDYAIWISKNTQTAVKFLHTIEHSHHSEQSHHEGNLTPNIRRTLLTELSDEERVESKKLIANGKLILENAKDRAEKQGVKDVVVTQRHGTLPETLEDWESEISIVVLGSKGKNHGSDKGLGFHLEGAIKAVEKPVFIVKTEYSEPKRLMFAYNGSPTSRKILEQMKHGLFFNNALEIHIVCIQKELEDAKNLTEEARTILSEVYPNIVTKPLVGDAMEALTQYQQDFDIDITAMGAFSHGKVHGFFFGSFTTKILLEGATNFLLVR